MRDDERRKVGRAGKSRSDITRNNLATDEYPSSPWPKPLKPQHALFVDYYLGMAHFNGAEAARLAGFSKKTARTIASEILTRPDVRAELKRQRYLESERIGAISRERLEREVAAAAFANYADFGPMFGDGTVAEKLALLTREQAAAVQEITVEEFRDGRTAAREVRRTKLKLVPKVSSLELLARTKGWIRDTPQELLLQTNILAIMLKEIADEEEGKPIIDITGGV